MIDFDNNPATFNPPSLNFDHDYTDAILIFDDIVWEDILAGNKFKTHNARSKTGRVYENFRELKNGNQTILLAYPNTGASAAVIDFELLIASGIRKFVAFGTCGVFDANIPQNSIIVPTFAIREEGTSYHYLPTSETLQFSNSLIKAMQKCVEAQELAATTGTVWTTDAVYRETLDKIKHFQSQGCVGVEMELSALMAVAQFRKVAFAQFLIVDDLVPPQPVKRKINERNSEKYMNLALDILNTL